MMNKAVVKALSGLAIAASALVLGACAPSESAVVISDAWVKATDTDMSALFGTISNNGDADVTLTGATSPVAMMAEIHEVVDGVMREKPGGLRVPAGHSAQLAPGADHIMLMGLSQELLAGDMVSIVVELSDGSALEVQAMVKNYTGANEEYDAGNSGGMEEMDMDMDMEHQQ